MPATDPAVALLRSAAASARAAPAQDPAQALLARAASDGPTVGSATQTKAVNPATDFGGSSLYFGPFNTHIPLSENAQNYLAGAGKFTMDLLRGVGQDVGLVSRKQIAQHQKLDAPLMATKAGKGGYITGGAADLLPTAFVPGANTLTGATAIGALTGLAMPSASTKQTVLNTGLGAASGPLSLALGRGLGVLWNAGKSVVEPFLEGGQRRIASRALQAFAGGAPASAEAALRIAGHGDVLPGVQPTTAELAHNSGLAQFERTLRNNPESQTAFTARDQSNRIALTSALHDIAGNDADREVEEQTRAALTRPLYENAASAEVPSDSELSDLLSRPSLRQGWNRAQKLADERGESLVEGKDIPARTENSKVLGPDGNPVTRDVPEQRAQYSGKAIQYLKMALNDMVDEGERKGIGAHESGALKQTLGKLNSWIYSRVPALTAADRSYEILSENLNQMDVARALQQRLEPALSAFGNDTRLNANSFANAMNNGDRLAVQVTGLPHATLESVLTPEQLTTVRQIGEQLGRRANAQELGRAVGSNTAQNLVGQNLLRQIMGPLGLPQSAMERAAQSTIGESLMRPAQWAAKVGEKRVLQELTRAALDPDYAARLLSQSPTSKVARLLWQRQGALTPFSRSLLGSLGSPSVANATQQ